jgi:predicted SnoaL-like aldol condensation-catalyzing enzyme
MILLCNNAHLDGSSVCNGGDKKMRSLATVVLGLVVAMPVIAQQSPEEAARLEANKQLVLKFFATPVGEERRKMLTDDYIQHNPRFVELTGMHGSQAWLDALNMARGKIRVTDPDFNLRSTPVILMAEGDLVTAIYKAVLPNPDDPSKTYEAFNFETLRIRDGKLAEHWDALKLEKGWKDGLNAPVAQPAAPAATPR